MRYEMRLDLIKFSSPFSLPNIIIKLKKSFNEVHDSRKYFNNIFLDDCLMSVFAIFNLKFPSLLSFENYAGEELNKNNLKKLFHINKVPSDTYMREVCDEISPKDLNICFKKLHESAKKSDIYRKFLFLEKYHLISIDGTEFYSSNSIK